MKWLVSSPQKLAGFLQAQFDGTYSGKQLRRALEANLCRVNGAIERFASTALKRGDTVELAPSWKSILTPNLSGFETLYEDEFLKIVDKPPNWVCNDASALRSFGPKHSLVHRLDKDTTGLLLLAKTPQVRDRLMELFEQREVTKTYLALVDGIPKKEAGRIESFFAKKGSFEGQTIWGSSHAGLTAITDWEKVASGAQASLILCKPLTGRTHQLRVHLAEMGHPILIDRQYAKTFRCRHFIQRPMLHAHRLQFVHPFTQKEMDIMSAMPSDMQGALKELGLSQF
ncbi:MAG TPA: RluA family pseudouridine synthase [Chlamydiales bacterium]|nr:RluA family pseudouridine synthase [Chlamydiales bacterium]